MKFRIYNKTLEPQIWNENMCLKPEIRANLLKIAQDFYKSTDLKAPIIDVLFLGSVTNYNWTPTSDIDLHLVVDITKENIAPEHARQFMDGLGGGWNNSHEIEMKGHPIEVYIQDQTEKNSTPAQARKGSAIYSVLRGCWLKKPDKTKIDVDKEKIKQKYHKVKKMVDDFVADKDVDKLKKLMKALKNYRNVGLEKVGEFSTENLVFKALRHTEVITKLKDAINSMYDKSVSINEVGVSLLGDIVVLGNITPDLEINKVVASTPEDSGNHIGGSRMPWRYRTRSDVKNYVFWWHEPSEKQKDALRDFLVKKYRAPYDLKHRNLFAHSGHVTQIAHGGEEPLSNTDTQELKEIVGAPFLVVGFVNKDLQVVGKKDTVGVVQRGGLPHVQHGGFATPGYRYSQDFHWRYKSANNTIYWLPDEARETDSETLEMMKDTTLDYLHTKFGVVNPRHSFNTEDYFEKGHYVNESFENAGFSDGNLYVGFITPDFRLQVRKATHQKPGHRELFPTQHFGDHTTWRYRVDLNELYWWDSPSEDEKEMVVGWLKTNLDVTTEPKHIKLATPERPSNDLYGTPLWYRSHPYQESVNEEKFNPFKAKELEFVTFGGLSHTKQRGYGKEDPTFHSPPARKGIYAFVWPYIEKFLLGGGYADPKQRGKGQRQRAQYVKDKDGNVVTSDHPEYEKFSQHDKNWSFHRPKADAPENPEKWEDSNIAVLYRNSARKKFKYSGPLWHHLGEFVGEEKILDRKSQWVKTDMNTFKDALKKELHRVMTWDASQNKGKQFRGLGQTSHIWDNLEVFIDQKI